MSPSEYAEFSEFLSRAGAHEGYRHLTIQKTATGFHLADTTYGYSNTVFGARLGVRHAQALFAEIRSSSRYEALRRPLLSLLLDCRDPAVETRVSSTYNQALREDPAFAAR